MSNKYWLDLQNSLVWAPLALPTLKLVQPKLRSGAVVIVDNTVSGADRYKELLEYLRAPESGFSNLTLPYNNGLDFCIYRPKWVVVIQVKDRLFCFPYSESFSVNISYAIQWCWSVRDLTYILWLLDVAQLREDCLMHRLQSWRT